MLRKEHRLGPRRISLASPADIGSTIEESTPKPRSSTQQPKIRCWPTSQLLQDAMGGHARFSHGNKGGLFYLRAPPIHSVEPTGDIE